MQIGLDHADQLIARGRAAADELGLRAVFAVLDTGANMVAFARMDRAWLASSELAVAKARTSVKFQAPSEALNAPLQLGQPVAHFDHLNDGLLLMGGGLPILDDEDRLIGGIGVSGGTPEQDAEIARAALS
ncbi:heme-binding protein [Nocardia sp. XZ_19_385]|uniref:GlcG/HbpS family heme-binding protein n=1 Tax=Nocardia sp. XZ_19_385 TaxID=2769488 RepID=UPI00188E78B7|nr:heme-binding protein [Nocardia sp. XZ_19_385]